MPTIREVVAALRDGIHADIWYDAATYGDAGKEDAIERTQIAMAIAAAQLDTPLPAGIDWALLRKQKITLLRFVAFADGGSEARADLEGIVNLIDSIQDDAVDNGIATELEVFGDLG